jgi:hypothetical protein
MDSFRDAFQYFAAAAIIPAARGQGKSTAKLPKKRGTPQTRPRLPEQAESGLHLKSVSSDRARTSSWVAPARIPKSSWGFAKSRPHQVIASEHRFF